MHVELDELHNFYFMPKKKQTLKKQILTEVVIIYA